MRSLRTQYTGLQVQQSVNFPVLPSLHQQLPTVVK
jgi:hypothetical protein